MNTEPLDANWMGHLLVDADLDVEIDSGAGGLAVGRLTGSGHRLRLQVDHPEVLAAAAGRSVVAGLAAGLAQAGISAELHGPRGRIAHVDPGRTSRIGALVTGSSHVGIDPAAWALAAAAVSAGARRMFTADRVLVWVVGAGAAAVITALVAHRRAT